jgi:hypothetical protein
LALEVAVALLLLMALEMAMVGLVGVEVAAWFCTLHTCL